MNQNSITATVMRRLAAGIGVALVSVYAQPGLARADDVVAPGAIVTARPGILNLRTGDVTVATLPNLLNNGPVAGGPVAGPLHAVIMLDGPMDPAREAALSAIGVRTLGYLPLNAFIADLSKTTMDAVRALGFVTWAGDYQSAWKVESQLANGGAARAWANTQRQAIASNGEVIADIWLFADADANAAAAAIINATGARILSIETIAGTANLHAAIPAANAKLLAGVEDVQWADEPGEYSPRSNSVTRWMVQSGNPNQTPLYNRGITGTGQVIGVIDGGIGAGHCAFNDSQPFGPTHRKILAYNTPLDYNWHGTHVACTAAGDSLAFDDSRGIAFGAKIVYNNFPDPTEAGMYAKHQLHYSQGARVHSNSWGDNNSTQYDGPCRALDAFLHDFDDQLIAFAVSDGSLIANPENAKNILAVAASGAYPSQDTFCFGGAGPTNDGRRKPEITAPGCNITSAFGATGCALASASGTSMATPALSGTAVLVRQYFTDGFYPSGTRTASDSRTPSGALVKAVLINSAVDLSAVSGFPSPTEGWGRVLADNGVFFAGDARKLVIHDTRNSSQLGLTTGALNWYDVTVTNPAQSLKVTLSYFDAPALANATFAPINNLNLEVRSPSGILYKGNVFSGGVSVTGGSADALNNIEQVLIAAPDAGRWNIRILGAAVNVGPQGYALAITGGVHDESCVADFTRDGGVGIEDLLLYLDLFGQGVVDADVTNDGGVGIEDLLEYLDHFLAGC